VSAHLAIQTAIVALLAAGAPALASSVKANALRPMAQDVNTAIVVRVVQSRGVVPQTLGAGYRWETVFQVDCLARGAGYNTEPVAAVDAMVEGVVARLSSWAPASNLGVIDAQADPSIDWSFDDAESPLVAATFSFSVRHRTQSTSLAAFA
jgi:hypothetical protein